MTGKESLYYIKTFIANYLNLDNLSIFQIQILATKRFEKQYQLFFRF